ncbi:MULTISPECIES: SOS response-associated peptidase family protein [unclassified Microbacterium]|uniref:SOS response-associated peptidase family protein n=1 Tax=unclassified Microbacterium TaxID=2609290 RepID=UPI000C2BF452|nr:MULTISPECIES: SOS response-associated peptidase family protein [unclassified Microbacterium]
MCASYGLDPRFKDADDILAGDVELLDNLRSWAVHNGGQTLLPTGKNLRNVNPIVQERDGYRAVELAWWGYLVKGQPANFPSINTRSERLMERTAPLPARAVVPATTWFEMQKPSRQWFQFEGADLELLAMAAVTQPGRTADGTAFTCYSIVMRPAPDMLLSVHDRMPLLIPATFLAEWLASDAPSRDVVEIAVVESDRVLRGVTAQAIAARP